MARPAVENPASRQTAVAKRRAGLFKKAHELAVLCDAEVAVIIISPEGTFHEFASSSMDKILARFRMCLEESGERRALQSQPEEPEEMVPKEVGGLNQKADKLTSRKWLDEDFGNMGLQELYFLEEKLNKGLQLIKDRKMKLLMEELEESKTQQEQKVLQRNQILLRQVEQLQSMAPPVYYAMPISAHYPTTEHESGPGDREFIPWTSFAAPLAITNGPETQGNFQTAIEKASLPPTSAVATDYGQPANSNVQPPADNDSHLQINTPPKPLLHWLPNGVY